jgi:hypothetical protein
MSRKIIALVAFISLVIACSAVIRPAPLQKAVRVDEAFPSPFYRTLQLALPPMNGATPNLLFS